MKMKILSIVDIVIIWDWQGEFRVLTVFCRDGNLLIKETALPSHTRASEIDVPESEWILAPLRKHFVMSGFEKHITIDDHWVHLNVWKYRTKEVEYRAHTINRRGIQMKLRLVTIPGTGHQMLEKPEMQKTQSLLTDRAKKFKLNRIHRRALNKLHERFQTTGEFGPEIKKIRKRQTP